MPKCEIFGRLDFKLFLYHKASMDRQFGTVIKNSNIFRFGPNFEFFPVNILSMRYKKLFGVLGQKKIVAGSF